MDEQSGNRQWNGKSRGGALGTWFFVATLKHLGIRAAYLLLAFVVPYFVLFAPKARRAVYNYNRNILHYGTFRATLMVVKHFYVFGQTIIDKIALKHGLEKQFSFSYNGYEPFINLLNSGKGVMIIGAHVGSWEVGAPFFSSYGKKMNIAMLDAEYERIKNVIDNGARQTNFKIIPLSTDGLDAILKIKTALDNGEYVCLQGDRYMDNTNSTRLTFMGREALFPKGLFQVAAKLNIPVVFYYALRQKHRHYNFSFQIAQITATKATERFEQITTQYIESLEKVVTQYPQQWFNFYDFWKIE